MEVREPKNFACFAEQIEKLKEHGVELDLPIEKVNFILQKIPYYRLSAYLIPYRATKEKYIPGTKLSTILRLYEMDSALRRIIGALVEHAEIVMRSYVSYIHSELYGSLGYEKAENFKNEKNHAKFIKIKNGVLKGQKNRLYVAHHKIEYGNRFPIWVLMEILTVDNIFHFYRNMKNEDQTYLANRFLNINSSHMENWFGQVVKLRNDCAHFQRFYNIPKNSVYMYGDILATFPSASDSPIILNILSCKYILGSENENWQFFINRMNAFFRDFSDVIKPIDIGFPLNWAEILSFNSSKGMVINKISE